MQKANDNNRPKLNRESLREALKIFEFIRPYRAQFIFGLILLFLGSTVFLVFPAMIGRSLDVAQGNIPQDLDLLEIGAEWMPKEDEVLIKLDNFINKRLIDRHK